MRFFVLLVAAVGCNSDSQNILEHSDEDAGADLECPNIEHIPVSSPQIIGDPISVEATITDETGVSSAIVYYKIETAITWKNKDLNQDGTSSNYTAEIPGTDVGAAAGMHYYIWAQDSSPELNSCTLPNDGEDGPFHFTIDAAKN